MRAVPRFAERGVALLAVLFALLLLALLALPFAVSMSVGAEAASREFHQAAVEQASASVRDLLLADAALSDPTFDPTPLSDGRDEWPDHVELPKPFEPLREDGRVLLGGEVWDQQRFFALDGVSPLVLANLLGTATRLREPLGPDTTSAVLEDAEHLPDSGYVLIGDELVGYGSKDGNTLLELARGLLHDLGYGDGKIPHPEALLVLDMRCVLAATWPFSHRGNGTTRRPFTAVAEFAEVAQAGMGAFTADELDTLTQSLSVDTLATTAANWGRPERVFDDLVGGKSKALRVKSALHIGAGSTIRLRNLRTGAVEYALVRYSRNEGAQQDLPWRAFWLGLLLPVAQDFPAVDTVIEPLIPAPVNLNTASVEVLTALFAEIRQSDDITGHDPDGRQRTAPPPSVTRGLAQDLAREIVSRRGGDPRERGMGPFTGWQDLIERVLKPRLEAASSSTQKLLYVMLYRNLETGRDSKLEMGTAPIAFASGPWVGYRAAASRARSVVAPGVVGRHERTGIAVAVPGFHLEHAWNTQQRFEEAFRLDRRAPYWTTSPVNLGALQRSEATNDPASRYAAHLVPLAFPELGLGAARYASDDPADAAITPSPASALSRPWISGQLQREDVFSTALDPRGHDVRKEGSYPITNTGPSTRGGGAATGSGRHDRISFPFSDASSFVGRWAASFWVEPQTLEGTTLFDHSDGDPERNRIAVMGKDGNLVVEVIDEAGIDPDPSASPSGVERTAAQWTLPLAELQLPPDTPLHLSVSAYGNRADDLSVAIDGMVRGKPKYRTTLTAAIPVFDPNLGNNGDNPPGQPGSERYLDLQVESTEGFPPQGVVRIGTELFEYSSINGNSFVCRWQDSMGGRGVRMIGREFRPDIPLDPNGEPTIDLNDPSLQGVNLDVFPAHPVGSQVELYGYSTLLSDDSPMMVGTTQLASGIGGFAVARAWLSNPRVISLPTTPPRTVGFGLDASWTGDLELCDPVPTGRQAPRPASAAITDAFPSGGGYALLVQYAANFDPPLGSVAASAPVGGVEIIKYGSRQGNKLNGVLRTQTLPGNDGDIDNTVFQAGVARQFVVDWEDLPLDPTDPQMLADDYPTMITWVVPVSLALQNVRTVWDPQTTGLTEWVQLLPKGGDPNDAEWVRYDAIVDNAHLVRGNRAAWNNVYEWLTYGRTRQSIQLGGTAPAGIPKTPPWGNVQATSGYIGYTPKVESDFPQIQAARGWLQFRGDPFTRTSSHAHSSSTVMACQRLQLNWGNWGAFTGRIGRNDRVALVQGSIASGAARPAVEWHTATWSTRRYNADTLLPKPLREHLGPWPFQLVAFTDGVQGAFIGPASGTVPTEPRQYDRVVKFPSGELPAAFCENVAVGSGVGNLQPITGFVDEIEVTSHPLPDLIVETEFDAGAKEFRVLPETTFTAAGTWWTQTPLTGNFPSGGGLVQIDGEIVAYQAQKDGVFTVAVNGRGLLNTEAKGHDRGARVHFLTHRPMAILSANVGPRDDTLPLQAQGALPNPYGTVLLGRELLHYTWVRSTGDQASLQMPRWFPPGEDPTSAQARGLFRGRFGSTAQGGSTGEPVIGFPFRHWDRFAERSDDPELAYAQLTTTSAPAFFRTLSWREETRDPRVDVVCLVRADGRAEWTADPDGTPDLWRFDQAADAAVQHRLATQASRLELRFQTVYKPGVLDLVTFRQHGWKTTARVEDVRVDYEGQRRIVDERVTAR